MVWFIVDILSLFGINLRLPDPVTGNNFHRPNTGLTTRGINEAVIDSPQKRDFNVKVKIIEDR